MKQKLFSLLAFLFLILPTITQNFTHELQNLSTTLKNLTSLLRKKPTSPTIEGPDFITWKSNCDKLPKYEEETSTKKTALTFELFANTLETYFTAMKQFLGNSENWLDGAMPKTSAWNADFDVQKWLDGASIKVPFVPFVEKINLKITDIVAFHGDFHGDVHACNNFIQTWVSIGYMDTNFKIINDNFYIIFLGDYTDRGWYGAEVIYTLLRLKIANPTQVFMARGNHEDLEIIAEYGFLKELLKKFTLEQASLLLNKITRFYNFLPMAVYFSCPGIKNKNDTVQCCHGGIEIGYDPKKFLASNIQFAYVPKFMRTDSYARIKSLAPDFEKDMQDNIVATTENGFMWSDFIVDNLSKELVLSGRGEGLFAYGKKVTKALLLLEWSSNTHTLRAIFRAHQHNNSNLNPMKQIILNFNATKPGIEQTAPWYKAPKEDAGIAFLWSESPTRPAGSLQNIYALTFSVAPGTPYDWPYDAFGLLTLAEGYNNWHMKVYTAKRSQYEKE